MLASLYTNLLSIVFGFFLTPSEFYINIENTAKGIELRCEKGCNWTSLEVIDGRKWTFISDLKSCYSKDSDNCNYEAFLFSIRKSSGTIFLKGQHNTHWIDLSFTLRKGDVQLINNSGMIAPKP
tara:strand:- start:538 stop:909 length:372 start_codon:yes stop_codon:yes gene_type:complete